MPEMPHAGEYHRHARLVGGGDGFSIAHRAAGLDNGGDAGSGRFRDRIGEGEEGIRGHHRAA